MAPPALTHSFSPYQSYNMMASPKVCRSTPSFTYVAPKSSNDYSLMDFIAKLSVVHLQRNMLCMQLHYGDYTLCPISHILNTIDIKMNRQHAKNLDEPNTNTFITDINQPFEYDSDSLSESNSLETPSDEDAFYQEENDYGYPNLIMNSIAFDYPSKLNNSVCDKQMLNTNYISTALDGQESDDDGRFSLGDAGSEEDWDLNWDTNCDDLLCYKNVPFWQTVFKPAGSDDECDTDDCDDDDDDMLFSDTPTYCFNKLFENDRDIKTDSIEHIPSPVGKANDRWNKLYTDANKCHKASKVQFAAGEKLETKHLMVVWSYAYQAARKGDWIQIHVDAERFRCRIEDTQQVLNPILDPSHRLKIFANHINTGVSIL